MSKIFRIIGNFEEQGKWSDTDPRFEGMIFSRDNCHFVGFCDEMHCGGRCYLAGYFTKGKKEHDLGIEFFKMCNDPCVAPVKFLISDLGCYENEESGFWAWITYSGIEYHGKAKVIVEDVAYSKELEEYIRTIFSKLNKNINGNEMLVREAQTV